jgi:hypothetical protein
MLNQVEIIDILIRNKFMMFEKLLQLSLLIIFTVSGFMLPGDAIAQTAKDEDMFDKPLQWAAYPLPGSFATFVKVNTHLLYNPYSFVAHSQ